MPQATDFTSLNLVKAAHTRVGLLENCGKGEIVFLRTLGFQDYWIVAVPVRTIRPLRQPTRLS